MAFKKRKRNRPEPDITPMIDVVFQLIIFLMVTMSFTEIETIDVELPTGNGTKIIKQSDAFHVGIDRKGNFFLPSINKVASDPLDKQKFKLLFLQYYPKKVNEKGEGTTPVVISGDIKSNYEDILMIINYLNANKVYNFSFAINKRQ